MSSWTVYTTGADIGSLAMVFNGVAMLCKQTPWIWGLAAVAAALSSLKGATMVPAQGASAASTEGFGSPLVILFIAFLLTAPGLKTTVQIESSRTGAVTQVDNVPVVMVAIPSFGSTFAHDASGLVRTAFAATNPSYDVMSSSGNGFIDPMRRLLAARSAILRLGGINSQIQSVASACLGGDAGVDYVEVNNAVVRAGNLPGGAADVPILGVPNTSIGYLLGQASRNTEAVVYDLEPNSASMMSCSAAAAKVAADIGDALQSKDFARVVQVGVSGLDEADPSADHSFGVMASQFGALRRWNTVVGNLAGGQQQANAELINLLFAETVMSTLNCLKAGDFDRANCEAAMVQAVEIERANLQTAAAAMPAVATMGAFARQMLALVIGLGPLILLLAMFSGFGAWSAVRTTAQIILWPMLAVDVGAEIVNGLMLKNFSDFMATLSQQGYLSPLTTYGLYKELSLKIGVGSSIMASLPVIMGTIFGLSAAAGLRSAATAAAARGAETAKAMAPSATEAAPLVRQTAPLTATQGVGFYTSRPEGALEALHLNNTVGTVVRDTSRALSTAQTRQQTLTEGKSNNADWQKAFQTGNYSKFGISRDEGESIRKQYEASLRVVSSARTGTTASGNKDNSNQTNAGVNAGVGLGGGGGSGLLRFNVGVDGGTKTSATDTKTLTETGGTSRSADEAKALSMALNSDVTNRISHSRGSDRSDSLRKAQSVAKRYEELLTKSDTSTDAFTDTFKVGGSLVTAHGSIGANQMAYQMQTNTDFQRFHADRGFRRDQDPSAQKYLDLARLEMAGDIAVTEAVQSSPRARDAVLRTRAAILQFNDESASKEDRANALTFLTDSLKAMTHMTVGPEGYGDLQRHDINLRNPKDQTGAANLVPDNFDPVKAGVVRGSAPKAQTAATGGAPAHAPRPTGTRTGTAAPPLSDPQLGNTQRVDAALDAEANPLKGEAAAVQSQAQDRVQDAKSSGLAQQGPGTAKRTARNVVDNTLDVNRDKAVRSSTRFGREESPQPPAERPTDRPKRPPSNLKR